MHAALLAKMSMREEYYSNNRTYTGMHSLGFAHNKGGFYSMKIQWWFEPWITSRYCALSSKRINLFRRCQIVHHVELSFCFPKQAAISEKILTPGVENLSLQWRILAQISVDAFTSIAESSVRAFVLAGRFLIYIYLFSHGFFALPFNYEERTLIPGFYVSSISSRPLNSRFTTHGLNRKYLQ